MPDLHHEKIARTEDSRFNNIQLLQVTPDGSMGGDIVYKAENLLIVVDSTGMGKNADRSHGDVVVDELQTKKETDAREPYAMLTIANNELQSTASGSVSIFYWMRDLKGTIKPVIVHYSPDIRADYEIYIDLYNPKHILGFMVVTDGGFDLLWNESFMSTFPSWNRERAIDAEMKLRYSAPTIEQQRLHISALLEPFTAVIRDGGIDSVNRLTRNAMEFYRMKIATGEAHTIDDITVITGGIVSKADMLFAPQELANNNSVSVK